MKLTERSACGRVLDRRVDFPCLFHGCNLSLEIAVYQLRGAFGGLVEQVGKINLHIQRLQPLNPLAIAYQLTQQRDMSGIVFDPDYIEGRDILLIDDILTTGMSFTLIKRELEKLGANSVTGIFLAKTV